MKFIRHDYTIAGCLLPALINDDYSGLDDNEHSALEALTDKAYSDHGLGFWDMSPNESPAFKRCEALDLMADCYSVTYYTKNGA